MLFHPSLGATRHQVAAATSKVFYSVHGLTHKVIGDHGFQQVWLLLQSELKSAFRCARTSGTRDSQTAAIFAKSPNIYCRYWFVSDAFALFVPYGSLLLTM